MKQFIFIMMTLVLLTGLTLAEENTSVSTNISSNQSNTTNTNDTLNSSTQSSCGKLIFILAENCPHCDQAKPEMEKFAQFSGCVDTEEHILLNFMNLPKDELALKYHVNYVPAFIFIDKNNCFKEIGHGGSTTSEDLKNGIANFQCEGNYSFDNSSTINVPSCHQYTCSDGSKAECKLINNECSCESCPSIPIEPNSTTGPIEIPESSNNSVNSYLCGGCLLDKKCYPFGYRKDGNYCSDNSTFTLQEDSNNVCENNFECSSNVCVSSKCISPSLIDNIINWFKKLFG